MRAGAFAFANLRVGAQLTLPEQEAEVRFEIEVIGANQQPSVDAGPAEFDGVAGLAFDHGAFHLEAPLDVFGPLPGDLARLRQAELM